MAAQYTKVVVVHFFAGTLLSNAVEVFLDAERLSYLDDSFYRFVRGLSLAAGFFCSNYYSYW